MIIIQRFTNINLHLSVIWQASSLKSHSLYLKLIHVQQFSTSNRVVIKSQEPRGIPSATLKVTPSYFINKYKKKRPKEIPRDAWFPNLLVVLLAYINPKTGNLSDNPATWRKARGKGQEYEDKGKTSQEKNKGMKKKHHVSGYWTLECLPGKETAIPQCCAGKQTLHYQKYFLSINFFL